MNKIAFDAGRVILDSPDSDVLLFDGDGTTVRDPQVSLTFEADHDHKVGRPRANLVFSLDLGALGKQAVYVQVPPDDVIRWSRAVAADLWHIGEACHDLTPPRPHACRVTAVADEYGQITVHDFATGEDRKVHSSSLSRPRTMVDESGQVQR